MFAYRGNWNSLWPVVMAMAIVTLLCSAFANAAIAQDDPPLAPYRHGGSVTTFFPNITYDPAIPTPESVLGFELGSRPVRYDEMVTYLQALAVASPRASLHPFGHTHEGRTLYYLLIGSGENFANAEAIRAGIEKLTQPSDNGVVTGGDRIIDESPAIAWMAYSIHGDELSGVDASLWTAYQLLARNDDYINNILENVLILIDPSENPDGRERYLAQIFSYAGVVGNTDGRSVQHDGVWPWGRANHYQFDMNRDWLPVTQPETQGRVAAILHWNPQLVVDAHEMGAYSTFLFSPPREPINYNVTSTIRRWWDVFAEAQGAEFDKRRWSYYTGDWNEEWFPGYASSWSLFTGAVGILYEQAGVAGSGVKRDDGTTLTYAQAVAQQSVSSLANLTTLADNRRAILSDYAKFHSDAVTGAERSLRGAVIFAPKDNPGREHEFLSTLVRQGLRVKRATASFSASVQSAGGERSTRSFPAGTYIVPFNQPRGLLAKAILEFDPHLSKAFLDEERRELLKGNGTRLYEVSGWALPLAYDLDITYSPSRPGVTTETLTDTPPAPAGEVVNPNADYGFLLPTLDDRSMAALVRMFDSGLQVRASEKPFVHDDVSYAAGTLLLRRAENPEDLPQILHDIAAQTGVRVLGVSSGYSQSGPDLGSDLFDLLIAPRIGLVMGPGIDFTSFGSLWFLLDHELKQRLSLLAIDELARYDLSVYNVLVLPSYWGGPSGLKNTLGSVGIQKLKGWVEDGGTLIAIESAAYFCADSASGLSNARERGDILAQLDEYDQDYQEELTAHAVTVDTNRVWRGPVREPEPDTKPSIRPDITKLKQIDDRARLFQPRGVMVRLDLDPEHYLSFGTGGRASGIIYTRDALMARDPVAVPARIAKASEMRLAGLLWPEARARWATTAFLTQERRGKGQVILFAGDPFFRAYFHGTKRLFLNAALLGPGMGTRQPAPW
jgi:hypothetical protein